MSSLADKIMTKFRADNGLGGQAIFNPIVCLYITEKEKVQEPGPVRAKLVKVRRSKSTTKKVVELGMQEQLFVELSHCGNPDIEQGEARRNTLALHAVDGAPNQQRGLYRKVSVGRIGSDAEIVWEYKTPDGWLEASSEEEAKVLCSPNRPTSSTPAGYWEWPAESGKKQRRPVNTLREAVKVCQDYINRNGLGGGNWTGGHVWTQARGGEKVAYISYNGRVWKDERLGADNEIVLPKS